MPRKKRFYCLDHCHHVMLRGVEGRGLFLDDGDRIRFCLLLQAAAEKHTVLIHAFCLMSNHIHLVLEPKKSSLQSAVHAFAFRYAQYFNHRYDRQGYLFQGRFKSIFVENGLYLKRLVRYIHLNPVQAGLVKRSEEYRWSSHRAYMSLDEYVWLKKDFVLSRFHDDPQVALERFVPFMNHTQEAISDLTGLTKAFRAGAYGTDEFMKNTLPEVQIAQAPSYELSLKDTIQEICNRFQVTHYELSSTSKERRVVNARSILALLGRQVHSWKTGDVALALGKHDATVSRLASRAAQNPELVRIANLLLST